MGYDDFGAEIEEDEFRDVPHSKKCKCWECAEDDDEDDEDEWPPLWCGKD